MKKLLILAAFAGFVAQASADVISTVADTAHIGDPQYYCECKNGSLDAVYANSLGNCSVHKHNDKWIWTKDGMKISCGENPDDAARIYCSSHLAVGGRCQKSGWTGRIKSVKDNAYYERPTDWEKNRGKRIKLQLTEKCTPGNKGIIVEEPDFTKEK